MTERGAQHTSRSLTPVLPLTPGLPRPSAGIEALSSSAGFEALMAGSLGRVIRIARVGARFDQAALAHRTGASQATVSRAEQGKISDPILLGRLCAALDILTHQPTEQDAAYSEDMRRRDLLRNVAAAVSAAMLPAAVVDPAFAGRIGAVEIAAAWEALRRLQTMEDQQGGGTVYQLTAGIAGHLQQAVGTASYGLATGTKLREVTAAAAVRAGWQAFDSGRRDSARRWWLEARHLGDLGDGAEDAGVRALVALAIPARQAGRGQEAVGLATAARTAAGPSAHPRLVSLLSAREAIGHAVIGDTGETVRCLSAARRLMEPDTRGDAPSWLSFWGAGDFAVHEMHAARALGNVVAAERAAREAVRANGPQTGLRNQSLYSAYLGHALVEAGKLDESISVMEHVLASRAIAGSQRVAVELRKTGTSLARHHYQPARDLADRIDELVPAA